MKHPECEVYTGQLQKKRKADMRPPRAVEAVAVVPTQPAPQPLEHPSIEDVYGCGMSMDMDVKLDATEAGDLFLHTPGFSWDQQLDYCARAVDSKGGLFEADGSFDMMEIDNDLKQLINVPPLSCLHALESCFQPAPAFNPYARQY